MQTLSPDPSAPAREGYTAHTHTEEGLTVRLYIRKNQQASVVAKRRSFEYDDSHPGLMMIIDCFNKGNEPSQKSRMEVYFLAVRQMTLMQPDGGIYHFPLEAGQNLKLEGISKCWMLEINRT